ncbi:MAG TPA: methyltransferase domain-containing protein, partial [Hansschlegelia sp.]
AGEIPKTFSVEESESSAFIQQFIQRSLRSGFVHRDFKRRNVIKLPDGRLSLIDLEAPIVALAKLKRRSKSGTRLLPTLIHKYYPEFIHSFIDGSTRDPEILSARRRWKTPPPFRIILSESGPAEAEAKIVRVEDVKERPLIGGIRLPSGEITTGRRANGTLRRRNAVVASSFDLKGKRVLDVGCSHGLYSLSMARVADEVVGIDHRISKIELGRNTAEKLGIKNVTFDYGDVRDPNLLKKHGKFDLIIAWGFLHRVSDLFSLLYGLEPLSGTIFLNGAPPSSR